MSAADDMRRATIRLEGMTRDVFVGVVDQMAITPR